MRNKKKLTYPQRDPVERFSWMEGKSLQIAALVSLVFVAYGNSLGAGFHFDDQGIFLDPYVMGSGFGWKILRLMQTRPLTFLTFHWNYLAGGAAPTGFHLVNVLLHAANTTLVMLIARREWRGTVPLLAGALFAIHPLQTQAVNYVFERATLLATLFALLCLLLFLQGRYSLSTVAFGLSLLAKEETVALPAFLLLYERVHRRDRISWSHYLVLLALVVVVTVRLFYVLHTIPEVGLGFGTKGISATVYALTQCRVIWIYLGLFFLPVGLSLEHDITLSQGLLSPLVTAPALLLLALSVVALGWLAWRGNKPALWALGFFLLLSPTSSVIPVADLMFEHRTYFPLSCLALAAASLLARLHPPLRVPTLAVLLAMLLAGTIVRNGVWRDDRSLWSDVVKKAPRKARGYFQLGQAYASQDPARARQLYERGLEVEPESPIGHTNLGLLLLSGGDPETALLHFRQALVRDGENALVWNNIGAAHLRRGEAEEGIKAFGRALESEPCRFDARLNLMRALSYVGERERALLAGLVPASCQLLPAQVQMLKDERHSIE